MASFRLRPCCEQLLKHILIQSVTLFENGPDNGPRGAIDAERQAGSGVIFESPARRERHSTGTDR
jgi:hypothetical protein